MPYWHMLVADWPRVAIALGTLALAVGIALLVHKVIFAALERLASPGSVVGASLVRHGRRPARWVLPLLALLAALPATPMPAVLRGALQHLCGLGVIAALAWGVILLTDILADVVQARHRVDVADNLAARSIRTQVQVLRRVVTVVVVIVALSVMLMTFPPVRAIGASVLASAGLAGLVLGMAMRPTLASLAAGVQIALTQPIRMEDAVVVEGEWGWIEEITSTYVVVRIWDLRRLVLPLTYFIEHPFQNWTRATADLLGTVHLFLDYTVPVEELRRELERIVHASPNWRGQVCNLQVTGANERTLELRAVMDASNASALWDLRCLVREQLIAFVQRQYPACLPRTRAELDPPPAPAPAGIGNSATNK